MFFHGEEVFAAQVPNVWTTFGNVVFFPGGTAGKSMPFYVTGGIGSMSLQSRSTTTQFGYEVDTVGFEHFVAENFGGGVKIFRDGGAQLGLSRRLSLPDRERQRLRPRVLREREEPHGTSHLFRCLLHCETLTKGTFEL